MAPVNFKVGDEEKNSSVVSFWNQQMVFYLWPVPEALIDTACRHPIMSVAPLIILANSSR